MLDLLNKTNLMAVMVRLSGLCEILMRKELVPLSIMICTNVWLMVYWFVRKTPDERAITTKHYY